MRHRRDRLEQWDLRDPGHALALVASAVPLRVGTIALASFACHDRGAVDLSGACVVHDGRERPDDHEARELMRGAADRVAGPRRGGAPAHTSMIVICREGRVISTAGDWFWFSAWRYANHLADLFTGEHYVLTPHGWTGLLDDRAGFEPRLR